VAGPLNPMGLRGSRWLENDPQATTAKMLKEFGL
jgi:hypothetical protein